MPELACGGQLQDALDAGITEHGGKGLAFAVILPDGAKWVGVSGVSHGTTPVTPDMPFATGSITKTWTAAAILQLAGEGADRIDAVGVPVSDHKPVGRYPKARSAIGGCHIIRTWWLRRPAPAMRPGPKSQSSTIP
jgi:CubicO group peptidase (beta-lactamase class C family)